MEIDLKCSAIDAFNLCYSFFFNLPKLSCVAKLYATTRYVKCLIFRMCG